MRLGPFYGFEALGLHPQLIRHSDIVMTEVENPVYLLTWDDYNHLSSEALGVIKYQPHVVMVNPWFGGMESLPTQYGSPALATSTNTKVIENEPTFVWGQDPEACFAFYEKWTQAGCKVVSLPPACDTARHYPSAKQGFAVEVGFVGSYRPSYKEQQYKDYLWPYEDKLKIWNHTPWPRCYQGKIANDDLKVLYQNARVCPTLSGPCLPTLWALPERPFAILGSGGLTVLDCVSTFKHLFSPDEVLMPSTLNEYHQMMNAALHDEDFNQRYRASGYKAVMERHTYTHRMKKLLEELCIGKANGSS